ncbi:MAG: FG-GAP repeat protein [Gemmatimonadota bacterium]|nr:MAG: FG-GAP repeat protein [Gemmatimonadota bacterium]
MTVARAAHRTALVLVLASATSASDVLRAQTDPKQTVEYARGLIAAADHEGAVAILETITENEPNNGSAWAFLGYARHLLGDLDGALTAHSKAMEFEQSAPVAMFNMGLTYAKRGDVEQAYEWLLRARAAGTIDVTRVVVYAESEILRGDARWDLLFPAADELADPFVEDVTILHEWMGEEEGDEFGWIARKIGDVDGDGVFDFATSAPSHALAHAGKIYVYSGGTGELIWDRTGRTSERLGLGIESAGDVNADGVNDVIAGAPGAGKIYVYSGADGSLLMTQYGWAENELFGRRVAGVGDVNGDGHDDVLTGAPLNDDNGEDAGRIYLFSGRDASLLLTVTGEDAGDRFGEAVGGCRDGRHILLIVGAPDAGPQNGGRTYVYTDLSGVPAFTIESDETGVELGGMFVSAVGDVDGDAVPDVYASDWPNRARGTRTGRIYVHSGADGRRLLTLTGARAGDGFGIGTAHAGDVDGDGYADLIIGAWLHSGAAPSGGKVYVFSGADGSLIQAYTGRVMGETLGFDATGIGDVDGDGMIDFLVSSAWSAINGVRSGRVYIVSGRLDASLE